MSNWLKWPLAASGVMAAMCATSPASANSILASLTRAECDGATNAVPFEVVYEHALVANGVILTQTQRNNEEARQWADFTQSVMNANEPTSPDPYKTQATPSLDARKSLRDAVRSLVTGVDIANPGTNYVAGVDASAYGPITDEAAIHRRMQDFLKHQSQLRFPCSPNPDQQVAANQPAEGNSNPPAGGGHGGGGGGQQNNTPPQRVIIAQDLTGAQKSFASRNFALFSGKRDEQAGTESYSIQGVALFPGFMGRGTHQGEADWALRPYIGVSRTQNGDPKKEVNDFTFGLLASLVLDGPADNWLPSVNYFSVSGAWVTDDSHESSLTQAEIDYRPGWGGRLHDDRASACFFSVRCTWNVLGVADFVEVGDPTGKPSLANLHQYARLGYDVTGGLYLDTDGGSVWSFTTQYQLRDSFTRDNGDAQLFSAGIAFAPSDSSNMKVGVNYVRGENLTSLEEQEYWAFSLGFRR